MLWSDGREGRKQQNLCSSTTIKPAYRGALVLRFGFTKQLVTTTTITTTMFGHLFGTFAPESPVTVSASQVLSVSVGTHRLAVTTANV